MSKILETYVFKFLKNPHYFRVAAVLDFLLCDLIYVYCEIGIEAYDLEPVR